MPRFLTAASVALLVGVLTGCSSPTLYMPMNQNGGFSDTQVNQTTYEVRASVKNLSHPSTAEDYALLRAADIACREGFPYFKVLNKSSQSMEGSRKPLVTTNTYMTIRLQQFQEQDSYDARLLIQRLSYEYSSFNKGINKYLSCPINP